jgi:glycine/D-amino acid oxidase-like deaminating enzyme
MADAPEYDAIVIGGGFFGCSLALHLRRTRGWKVVILEAYSDLMQRASYVNQARVHNGYHYPRSILTGLRSRVNFPRFVEDFPECVSGEFDAYYAVARRFSHVTASQFALFCERIRAPISAAPKSVRSLFDPELVEDVYRVTEYAFDTARLKAKMRENLDTAGVEIRFGTEARVVSRLEAGTLEVDCNSQGSDCRLSAQQVFNCTYARVNKLLDASGLPVIPVKQEIAEIPLIEVPEELENLAITIMCGPFFSIMPFPARGLKSLYHVRYTLHGSWHERPGSRYQDPYQALALSQMQTNYAYMAKDAVRYMPCLSDARYVESLWEVRTVLPRSENDDSRPILFVKDHGLENLTTIVGAKIDNIYDMIESDLLL